MSRVIHMRMNRQQWIKTYRKHRSHRLGTEPLFTNFQKVGCEASVKVVGPAGIVSRKPESSLLS